MKIKDLFNTIDAEIQDGIATNITGYVVPEIPVSDYLLIDALGAVLAPYSRLFCGRL